MTKYVDVKHLLKKRYEERMAWAKEYLGGKCVVCGTTENLEMDHRDPKDKSFNISKDWGKPIEILKIELDKCQLLCKDDHQVKTIKEKLTAKHGSHQMYYAHKCRCDLCVAFWVAFKEQRRKSNV